MKYRIELLSPDEKGNFEAPAGWKVHSVPTLHLQMAGRLERDQWFLLYEDEAVVPARPPKQIKVSPVSETSKGA